MSQFSEPASEATSEATLPDSLEEDESGEVANMVVCVWGGGGR